jgi:RecA/RadA recombinase
MTKKFDFTKTIAKVQATYKKDERRASQIGLGSSLEEVSHNPEDYVVLDDWFKENTGVLGLKFGHVVQVAGDPDTGKTSFSLMAMRKAQEQGYGIIYVETEGKTSELDLKNAGIDPAGVIVVHTKITEEVFDSANRATEAFFDDFPDAKVLLIIDSYGNTISMRDADMDLTEKSALVGGAAKTNRMGIGSIAAKQIKDPIALLVVNYTYDNMGSPGKTNAGGKALDFMCMLTFQTQRTGWYEKTVGGLKVKAGADVKWRIYKNHYSKSILNEDGTQKLFPKEINLRITADGFQFLPQKA